MSGQTGNTPETSDRPHSKYALYAACCITLIIISVSLRLYSSTHMGLEYDETQSVTFAVQDTPTVVALVKAYDVHPPYYYLQLHYWMKAGTNDFWLRANSALWGGLTAALLFSIVAAICNLRIAIFAALLFAFNPLAVYYGQSARMYAALMFFACAAWGCSHQLMFHKNKAVVALSFCGGFLSCLGMTYFHGIGVLLLPVVGAFFVLGALEKTGAWKRLPWGALMLCMNAVAAYPWVAGEREKSITHTVAPSLKRVAIDLFSLFTGYQGAMPAVLVWGFFLLLLLLVCLALYKSRTPGLRALCVAFIFTPILIVVLLSHAYQPIWLLRSISWVVPFLCVLIAWAVFYPFAYLEKAPANFVWVAHFFQYLVAASFLLLFLWLIPRQHHHLPDYAFPKVAEYLSQHCDQDDIIFAPNRHYWGFAWYYAGAGSVLPGKTIAINTDGRGYVVNVLNAADFYPGFTYWLLSADPKKQNDLKQYLGYIEKGQLTELERLKIGRYLLIKLQVTPEK